MALLEGHQDCSVCDRCGLPMCPECDSDGQACPLSHEGEPHFGLRPFEGVFYEYYDFGDGTEVLTGHTAPSSMEYLKSLAHDRRRPPSREVIGVAQFAVPWTSR